MKPITIEKIPEGDAAREGASRPLRARALALRQAQRPRGWRWLFDKLRDRGGDVSELYQIGGTKLHITDSHPMRYKVTYYMPQGIQLLLSSHRLQSLYG